MNPLLRLVQVQEHFSSDGRQVRAVDGVSLDLYPGEALGLVGESGCGKSTLARCALLLVPPTSGQVWFDGIELSKLANAQLRTKRREFQMVFQDAFASLDPRMTVARLLAEPFEAHALGTRSERAAWIRALLDEVALDASVLSCYPAQLSGGQQQRVALARALALRPRLLVADEAFSALDASVQAQVLNLVSEIRKRMKMSVILISHSLAVVHSLCDRIMVMYAGRVVEEGLAGHIGSNPHHPYTRLLYRSMQKSDRGSISAPAGTADGVGCAFLPRCTDSVPRCQMQAPPLAELAGGGKVACFLYP